MGVDGVRGDEARVTEPSAEAIGGSTEVQHQARVRVSEIVEAHRRESRVRERRAEVVAPERLHVEHSREVHNVCGWVPG